MFLPESSHWTRTLAGFIDMACIYIAARLGGMFGYLVAYIMLAPQDLDPQLLEQGCIAGNVLGFLFWGGATLVLNYGVLQGLGGSSMGKYLCRIQVLHREGKAIGIVRSLVRTGCYIFSAAPLMAGFLMIYLTKNQRALHDVLCSTVVVKRGARRTVAQVIYLPPPSSDADSKKAA